MYFYGFEPRKGYEPTRSGVKKKCKNQSIELCAFLSVHQLEVLILSMGGMNARC